MAEPHSVPSGTVAFLFTDIASSTRLWQTHRTAMERAYSRHDAILRDAIAAHRGVVYKVIGDAFQIAFPTAQDAVEGAFDAQRALQTEPWAETGLPEPLRVRMALHACAAMPDPDGDYRTPGLNRLGRLLSAGHGGQVLLSGAAQQLARDTLPSGSELRELGEHRLRDLLEPEHVYQLHHPVLEQDFPLLDTLDARPNNLPRQPTPLVGREREVAEIAALLRRDDVQLLTLTGPGGTGKTRLGLQAAAELLGEFPDGVFFVPLAVISDPALVPTAIAEALGIREDGERPFSEQLRTTLASKRILLMLDNVEHVTAAAPFVGELLAACPNLEILATSRIPLRVRAEREYPVSPLGLPRRKPPPSLDQMTQYEAVRLFIERAQAVKPGFFVDNETAPVIAEICWRLDGLPLAIELAAARVRMLSPAALLARLEKRLPILIGGARDAPQRQQTLRDAIAWSHDLLDAHERALFRRLAVFAGGASIEALEVVANPDDDLDVFAGLERLVEHSLVRQEEGVEGEPRFSMLETIREYGLDQLDTVGEAEETRRRHADVFLVLAEEAEPTLWGQPGIKDWLARLEAEHDNIRAALAWSLEQDPVLALRLAGAVWRFWMQLGQIADAWNWLQRALAGADTVDVAACGKAQLGLAKLAWIQGEFDLSAARAEESLASWRSVDNPLGIARSLTMLADAAGDSGQHELARTIYEEALALCRDIDDRNGVSRVLNNLGIEFLMSGDSARAAALYREAHELARLADDPIGVITSLANLGEASRELGNLTEACGMCIESLMLSRDYGDKLLSVENLQGLGIIAALAHQPAKAAWLLGAAEAESEVIGFVLQESTRPAYERAVNAARASLGEEAFVAAWNAGRVSSFEDAIAEALTFADAFADAVNG